MKRNIIGIVGLLILAAAIFLSYRHFVVSHKDFNEFAKDYYANLSSELFGIAITILLIDYLYEQKEKESNKARLLRELASEDKGFTSRALREIRSLGYLYDGTLNGADLSGANLCDLDFANANLRNVNFTGAQLNKAIFTNSDLTGANLNYAELRDAKLENCKLTNVQMKKCNLYGAIMNNSAIENVDLMTSNLEACELIDVSIINVKLEDANIRVANLTRTRIANSNFLRADVSSLNARSAVFERCDFKDLSGWNSIIDKSTASFLACTNVPN